MSKATAKKLVNDFLTRNTSGKFIHLTRKDIGNSLLVRIDNPGKIDQGSSSLCGPAALLYNVASSNPDDYATFAIDLFEKGEGTIEKFKAEPSSDLKNYKLDSSTVDQADWMTLASIRDSQNWFFDYQSTQDEVAGITFPSSLESWMKDAGYTEVENHTNLLFCKDITNATTANNLFNNGWKVCLFINSNMLYAHKSSKSSLTPDHWVVLTSSMSITPKNIRFTVYTWGNSSRAVPKSTTLPISDFTNNYYGFVACKF